MWFVRNNSRQVYNMIIILTVYNNIKHHGTIIIGVETKELCCEMRNVVSIRPKGVRI